MECDHREKGKVKRTIFRYFIFLDRSFRSLTLRRNHLHSQRFKLRRLTVCKFYCRTETQFSRLLFVLFCVQNLCCNDSKYHSLTERTFQSQMLTNVDIFEKKQFSLQFLYSLLHIVHRVTFIFHLNVLLVSMWLEDSVICFADRGEGKQD